MYRGKPEDARSRCGHERSLMAATTIFSREVHKQNLLLFAHHLCDGVPDDGTSLLDFLLGEAGCDANLERSRNDLLRLKVILQSLETGDKHTVGEALLTTLACWSIARA